MENYYEKKLQEINTQVENLKNTKDEMQTQFSKQLQNLEISHQNEIEQSKSNFEEKLQVLLLNKQIIKIRMKNQKLRN